MWAVASCPKCGKQVAVPVGAQPASVMRCPLCRAEYLLEEALANLPPELEIVSSTQPMGEETEPAPASYDFGFIPPETPAPVAARPRSTTRMMLEVIIGGLLAGPIALAIIMWGFGEDPLHVSKKLPQCMVPPCLRAEPENHEPVIIDAN